MTATNLAGATIDLEVRRRATRFRRAGYLAVRLSGGAAELSSLALVCREVAAAGAPQMIGEHGGGAVTVYRSDQPLQVVALDPLGVLLCADARGLLGLATGVTRLATGPVGEVHRTVLHDRDGRTRGPIGLLEVARVPRQEREP